jgi:hypothetical protein
MERTDSQRALGTLRCAPHTWAPLWLAIAILGLESGCGKDAAEPLAPVSGRIMLNGQPLAGATVSFASDQRQVSAITGDDGRYQLLPGAPLGTCRVGVSKCDKSEANVLALDPGAAGRVRATPATTQRPKQLIPSRYSDPRKTSLSFTVPPEGTDKADFELSARE